MKIKNVEIDGNLFLAPMAGVTDFAFRGLAKYFGASLTYTEMISVKALFMKSKQTYELLRTDERETPCAVQLFGHEPDVFAYVLKNERALDKFDIIDINMGCPAPKIVKNGDGSALMNNIDLARQIIEACVNSTSKPITVKFRSGWDSKHINAVEFAVMCEKAGVSAICIHARTKDQGYGGRVDYDVIKNVKNAVRIPVIGSGDIKDENTLQLMKETGVDAFLIGRGALGKPYVFSQLKDRETKYDITAIAMKHMDELLKVKSKSFVVKYMRKHLIWYLKGKSVDNNIKKQLITSNSIEEMKNLFVKCIESSII